MGSRNIKWVVAGLLCLWAFAALAVVEKKPQRGLADLVSTSPRVNVEATVVPSEELRSEAAAMAAPSLQETIQGWDRFIAENGSQWHLSVDRRTGRAALAEGSGVPWVPGVGNSLRTSDLREVLSASGRVNSATLVRLAKQFLLRYPEVFGVDVADLDVNPVATGDYAGYLWYVQFERRFHGIPVEKSYVVFRVNNGNLIQFGGDFLGEINLDPIPTISAETARQILGGYVGGFQPGDQWLDMGHLSVIPMAPQGDIGIYEAEPGKGLEYHLVYTVAFRRQGEMGNWTAKIDAHTGQVLVFRDENEYGSIKGGIYITSNLDTETVRPMGFANSAGGTYANAAGVYSQTSGTVTTSLAGKYVTVNDSCGAVSLSATAPADINLGTSSGTDCTVPSTGGGAGDTHAARTTYYHLTLWKEKAMAWLPSNTWLQGSLSDKVNLSQTCNAYWDGTAVNFFKSGGGCSNTGELPTVFLHEVGHGLDSNDGSGTSTVGSSEMYADTNAILMTHQSCVGVNFIPGQQCAGYGNACTSCTGIRDADYTKHASQSPATPAQLSGSTGYHCSTSSSYPGPCGYEGHCESYIGAETDFDVGGRDLPAAGYDTNTAWYIMERLFYLSRPTSTDAYTCSGTSANGCGAGNWYSTFLAVDDDNGNLSDGTPHAAAIYAAFNRHAIACTTGSHVSYSACGAIGQPTLTATAGSGQVSLSWTAASGATKYKVLRGELGATASLSIIAEPTTTTYTDTTVAAGITYYYSVVAIGSSDACFGALAAVQSATPTSGGGTTYSISGTVSGAATSGVTMTLSGAASATTTTATGGSYSFSGLVAGSYTVTPSKSGYTFSPASTAVTVSSANQTGINFSSTAVPTYSISGTVGGAATSGVTMTLSGAASATTTTATGGTYSFSGLVAGSYTVTPGLSGYTFSPASSAVTVSTANVTGVNFTSAVVTGPTTLFSDGFESQFTGWATAQVSGTAGAWTAATSGPYPSASPHAGTYLADFNSYTSASGSQTRLYRSAGFAIPASASSATLTFWMYHDTGYTTSNDQVQAQVSTNGTTWTNVGSAVPRYNGSTGWAQVTVDLTSYKGQSSVQLGFLGISAYGNDEYLDDVAVVMQSGTATYSISGAVSGAATSSVTMTLSGAASATTTTATGGTYTFSGLANGSYTVTPSLSGFSFSPASTAVAVNGANVASVNFTATSTATYSISGTVSGAATSGVTMTLSGAASATTTTATGGTYTFSGLANGSYTVTPSLSGFSFSPASIAVAISGANQTGKNFTATAVVPPAGIVNGTFETGSLSGWTAGTGTGTVAPTASTAQKHGGSYSAYLAGSVGGSATNCTLSQSVAVPAGGGTLSFWYYPVSGDSVTYDWQEMDILNSAGTVVATPLKVASNTQVWTQVTANLASYAGQTITVKFTVHDDGYSGDQTNMYVDDVAISAPAATYSLSGTITYNSAGLSGVTVSTTGASATTDASGNYTLSGLVNGTYTVTPSMSGYTFSPASQSVTISGASVTGKNFTAAVATGPTTLFTNGFEASTGWASAQVSGTAGAWTLATSGPYPSASPHGGSYLADFNSYTSSSGSQTRYYRTAGFAIASTYTTATLTFWMYHDTGYSTYADQVQAQVSTNGTTWTNVGTAVARYNGTTGWAQVTVDLSAYKGQTVQLGFLGISAYGNDEYLDDVTVVAQ